MKTTELAAQALDPARRDSRGALFERVLGRIHRYFFRLTGDAIEAEDLAQTTLLLLQRSLVEARYQAGRSFNTWTFLKAHSVFVDWCRARDRAQRDLRPRAAAPAEDPAEATARRLDAAALLEQLAERLGPETYECFVLRYEAGLSLDEVADATDCTRRTVSRRLARAHDLLDTLQAGGEP